MKTESEIQNLKSKIVIVGAGPAGTSLAIRLAEKGFNTTLIEREKFPRHKLCGEFISPECLEHFRELGVFAEMTSQGGDRITKTVFFSEDGRSVSIPSEWFGGDAGGALGLSRAEMDFRLLEKAKESGVEVLEETQVIGLLFEKISDFRFQISDKSSVSDSRFQISDKKSVSDSRFQISDKKKNSDARFQFSEDNEKVCGVKVRDKNGDLCEILSDLTIDATGRARVLGKLAQKQTRKFGNAETRKKFRFQISDFRFQNLIPRSKIKSQKPKTKNQKPKSKNQNRLVGFKAHLKNVNIPKGVCEIYFFRGGYGGLSFVENGFANHCFLIKADVVKEFGGDADKILENVIFKNERAFNMMKDSKTIFDWLAVSVDGFGRKDLNPAPGLFSVGDASAFIDPFTGSGMLMAFESAEILADVITEHAFDSEQIAEKYKLRHKQKFQKRLRICSVMRRASFVPKFAKFLISILSLSSKARELLARSTRKKILEYESER